MKLTIYKLIPSFISRFNINPIQIECEGEGTKEDPLVIDESNCQDFSNILLLLKNNNYFIHIRNLNGKSFIFNKSKNILIKNCVIEWINLEFCKNITITNCTFNWIYTSSCSSILIKHSQFLKLCTIFSNCEDLTIEHSNFEDRVEFRHFHNNYIKNCFFGQIYNNITSNNVFENCDIYGTDMIKLIERKSSIKNFDTWGFLLVILFLLFIMILEFRSGTTKNMSFLIIIAFSSVIIFITIVLFHNQKQLLKNKKRPPNIIK